MWMDIFDVINPFREAYPSIMEKAGVDAESAMGALHTEWVQLGSLLGCLGMLEGDPVIIQQEG